MSQHRQQSAAIAIATLAFLVSAPLASLVAQGVRSPAPAEIDRIFAAFDRAGSPGCALAVARGGEMLYERGYGRAELEWEIPITPATIFNVGSVSKQFVAASIVLLAEQGKLSLDDDVRRHIPELPRYGATITLRHLLHHTSGLRDMLELMILGGVDINTSHRTEEYLALLARQQGLNFPVGSQFLYSNSGYFLLGLTVARVSGMSLRTFAERHIFGPLGMTDTHFHDDARMIIPRRAMSYARAGGPNDGWVLDFSTNFDRVGPGGVNTTVRDLVRWDRALHEGGIGGPRFLQTMLTRGVLTNGDSIPYALALTHDELRGVRSIQHGGTSLGFRAYGVRFPTQRLAVYTLCNTPAANPSRLAHAVAERFLGDALRPEAASETPARAPAADPELPASDAELAPLAGEYRSDEVDATYTLLVKDGRLTLRRVGWQDVALRRTAPDVFALPGGTLQFLRESGEGRAFRYMGGRARGMVFRRVP